MQDADNIMSRLTTYNSPAEALHALQGHRSWKDFTDTVCVVKRKMDQMTRCILDDDLELKTSNEISRRFFDRRCEISFCMIYTVLNFVFFFRRHQTLMKAGVVPRGHYAGKSTANGDCLFNSVSLALFGNEIYKDALRLASVVHAVDHFDHYVEMVSLYRES